MRKGGTVWMGSRDHEKSHGTVRYLTMRLQDHERGGYCVNGMANHYETMRKLLDHETMREGGTVWMA